MEKRIVVPKSRIGLRFEKVAHVIVNDGAVLHSKKSVGASCRNEQCLAAHCRKIERSPLEKSLRITAQINHDIIKFTGYGSENLGLGAGRFLEVKPSEDIL